MRRKTSTVVIVLDLIGLASPVDAYSPISCNPKTQKCPAAVKYKNCDALRKVHPKGVARDAKAAGKSGATVDAATYKANAGSDRDKDGVACE